MNELLRQRWWIDGLLRGLPPAGLDIMAEKHARAGTTPQGYLYPELLEATDMPYELKLALQRKSEVQELREGAALGPPDSSMS